MLPASSTTGTPLIRRFARLFQAGAGCPDGGNCQGRTTIAATSTWVQWKVLPPSTASAAPVMNEDSEAVGSRDGLCDLQMGPPTRLSAGIRRWTSRRWTSRLRSPRSSPERRWRWMAGGPATEPRCRTASWWFAATVAHRPGNQHPAWKSRAKRRISGVPVVDDAGSIVRVMSGGGIWYTSTKKVHVRQARWLDMLAGGFELAPRFREGIQEQRRKVKSVMSAGRRRRSPRIRRHATWPI